MDYTGTISALPVRIIPFDLGRSLDEKDIADIKEYTAAKYTSLALSLRQKSILKNCVASFFLDDEVSAFVYQNGITVIVIKERAVEGFKDDRQFAILYGENRKKAHSSLFNWAHEKSQTIRTTISGLKSIVYHNSKSKISLRLSAAEEFENKGLSYVMTLSLFDVKLEETQNKSFKNYPDWLKSNIYALLDPSVIYLEDSSKFESTNEISFDIKRILENIEIDGDLKDYERHRHVNAYMSWAAVVVIGQIQSTDIEEYTALEVQLQSDWFYVYCLEKGLEKSEKVSKKDIVGYQRQSYELDQLENRLYDFDDSSMPTRILDIQRGLVDTSGLADNIHHLKRKIDYILEREKLNNELKQKKLGQSSEILLFIIAFIEIAPTVAEYGNRIYPNAGVLANILIVILGFILLIRKE